MKHTNIYGRSKDVPMEVIERWLKDEDWRVRAAAVNACQGKDVPLEVIERWLKDEDCDVRAAAMNACQKRGIPIPASRTFDPPKKVYKKCLLNVIVVAEIPADAHVRGTPNGKCRASKARIVEILGDFCGEQIGVSIHDDHVWYFVGDEVEIEDFDLSLEECSTGFHFFCSLEQAWNYN